MLETTSTSLVNEKNILNLKPERACEWEWNLDTKQAVILIPRYRSKLFATLFPQRYTKMELDDYGTFVWEACSGDMTVLEIAEELEEAFGAGDEPIVERLSVFLNRLAEQRLIRYRKQTT